MATIINIESSTGICSVTLAKQDEILFVEETDVFNSHSSLITVFIERLCKKSGVKLSGIDAVAVSQGPGSYTGLRIGVSVAKGLCYALDIPLISVCSMRALARQLASKYINESVSNLNKNLLFCPMIDARRMEVYCALFDIENEAIKDVAAMVIDEDSFKEELLDNRIVFFGDGAKKCEEMIKSENSIFKSDVLLSSENMPSLSLEKYLKKDFENIAYYEPFYLKDFIAGKPKVKGLI